MTYSTSIIAIIKRSLLVALSLVLTMTSIPVAQAAQETGALEQTSTIVNSDTSLLDEEKPVLPLRTYTAAMTAYTSAVDECDADPFTAADGTQTYDGMVAANFLPFGTKIRVPALFGDKVFVVHDRMNARYNMRVDVWMKDKKVARQFGLHGNVKIEIIEMGDGKTLYAKRAEEKRLALAKLKAVESEKAKTQLAAAKK